MFGRDRRPRAPVAVPLALLALLLPAACSWIEWAEEAPPAAHPAPPPAPPMVVEAPPDEPPFRPTRPPVPRPEAPPGAVETQPLSPPFDGRHVVKRGETLFSVARLYEVDTFTLASLNGLRPPYALEAGQVLRVPQRRASPNVAAAPSPAAKPEVPAGETPAAAVKAAPLPPKTDEGGGTPASGPGFAWPVHGTVISRFGARADGSRNDGIDIAASRGAAVRAARDGRVHYAGNTLRSYGNMVVIEHEGHWWTVYAHADELLIREGEVVRKGDVIARVGVLPDSSQPVLHFEMRHGKEKPKPVDPLRYLPRRRG